MKIKAVLNPVGGKNLNDSIYDIIDTQIKEDIKKIAIKATYWAFGIFGDNGNNKLFALVCSFFEDFANKIMHENSIYASAKNLDITKNGDELFVSVDVEDVDYTKSVTLNKQRIIDGLKNISPDNIAWNILDLLEEDTDVILSSVLKTEKKKKKESIIRLLINQFQSNICNAISNALADGKIALSIKSLYIGN